MPCMRICDGFGFLIRSQRVALHLPRGRLRRGRGGWRRGRLRVLRAAGRGKEKSSRNETYKNEKNLRDLAASAIHVSSSEIARLWPFHAGKNGLKARTMIQPAPRMQTWYGVRTRKSCKLSSRFN